jgi:hypothetical protein
MRRRFLFGGLEPSIYALFWTSFDGPCRRTLLSLANHFGFTLPLPFVPSVLAYRTPLDSVQQEGYDSSDRRPRPPEVVGCRLATTLGHVRQFESAVKYHIC